MRAKRSLLLLSFSSLLVPALHAGAQVSVDAIGDGKHLYAGVEGSDFKPDYNPIGGRSRYLGAEGEIRLLDLNKPSGQTQKNFFAGPIVDAYRYHRFTGYGKLMLGIDSINYPSGIGYGTYFAFAPGGGVEYRLNSRLKLRGEYEYQFVRSAPGFPNQPSNGLTPSGYSGGISYRIY
jgi:opacity protein-like surface antigen